jgi:hypothetical protein
VRELGLDVVARQLDVRQEVAGLLCAASLVWIGTYRTDDGHALGKGCSAPTWAKLVGIGLLNAGVDESTALVVLAWCREGDSERLARAVLSCLHLGGDVRALLEVA